jgi:hypothetical protein
MISNDKQLKFNEVRGVIVEIAHADEFSSITLEVGHSNPRKVNLCTKNAYFEPLIIGFKIGDKVSAQFYISSNKKHDRWYSTANLLTLNQSY